MNTFPGHATSCAVPAATPRRPVRDALQNARARLTTVRAASKSVPNRLPLPGTFRF